MNTTPSRFTIKTATRHDKIFHPQKLTQIRTFQKKRNAVSVTDSHHQRSKNVHPSFSQSGTSVMPVIPGYTWFIALQ